MKLLEQILLGLMLLASGALCWKRDIPVGNGVSNIQCMYAQYIYIYCYGFEIHKTP